MITLSLRETFWQPFHTRAARALLLGFVLVFVGFVCSRALVSIGMMCMVAAAVFGFKNFAFAKVFSRPELMALTLLFWGVFLSGLWSDDKAFWWNFTRIHLPFLFLPLAFYTLPGITNAMLRAIVMLYVAVMGISALVVLANYLLHFSAITERILSGGVIPMPYSHIRYALMITMALCSAIWLAVETGKKLWLLPAVFLFVFLHIVSVRSGLFAMYSSLLALAFFYFNIRGNFLRLFSMIVAIMVSGFALFHYTPSLKSKVSYMMYDLNEFKNNNPINASDGMRLRSWQAAWEVSKASPWLGVGYGDMQAAMNKWYAEHYPQLEAHQRKLPHNQWLWWLVATGWVGVLIFSFAAFYPFVLLFRKGNALWLSFFAIVFTSFFWEATLEEQMGTGFFIVWLLLLIQSKRTYSLTTQESNAQQGNE